MGWNVVKIEKKSKLFQGMYDQENRFYFVHSYHVVCSDQEDILTTTFHGYNFTSSFEKDNIVGGISRTVNYKNYYFDIGGHRFFTKIKGVEDIWKEVLSNDFSEA